MAIETYDPGLVVVIFAGQTITGFAMQSDAITAERDEDAWKKTAGLGGEYARTKNRAKGGQVKLVLMQTAAANDILSAQARLDELTSGGAAPLLIKDLGGRTVAKAGNAWILKVAKAGFGNEAAAREWTLDTGPLDIIVGGNALL